MRIDLISLVMLSVYWLFCIRYGVGQRKKILFFLLCAVLLNTLVHAISFGVGFTWGISSYIGKLIAETIGLSLPLVISTTLFWITPPYRNALLVKKNLLFKTIVAFGGGLLTLLPIAVPQYGVSLVDLVSLLLICSITGDCL